MDWDFLLETVTTFFLSVYFLLEGIVKGILPDKYSPRKDVSQDIVLITGAGSGLGRLMAQRFARLGAKLVLWDLNKQSNEATAAEINKSGGHAKAYVCDISNRDEVYAVADKVRQDVGNVTILINNAGIVTGKKFLQCPDSMIEKTMLVNAVSHFWTVKAFLPTMLDANRGHIVSIASSAGLVGINGLADYCASKFAAVGFMEALSGELEVMHKSIFTTTVCPFFINTGMFDGALSRFPSLLPILDPDYATDKIMTAILSNQVMLYMPRILYFVFALKSIFPVKLSNLLFHYFGASASMEEFKGRAASSKQK